MDTRKCFELKIVELLLLVYRIFFFFDLDP